MTAAELLAGADILLASVSELRRETQAQVTVANANSDDGAVQPTIDDNAVAVVAPIPLDGDGRIVWSDIVTSRLRASTSRSNISSSNSSLDDSVVIVGGAEHLSKIKPIGPNEDEDVIFVAEKRQPYRTVATIDLCESFDSPKKVAAAAAQTGSDDDKPSAAKKPCDNNNAATKSPQKSTIGTHKCPICLDMFTMDQILSTMCGHLFCAPCVQGVVKTRKKCPMCNRALKQNQLHRIFIDHNI